MRNSVLKRTDGQTDGQTDGEKSALVELRLMFQLFARDNSQNINVGRKRKHGSRISVQFTAIAWRAHRTVGRSVASYGRKEHVQEKNLGHFFENGIHFWTALTLQLVDGFQQFIFSNRSEFHLESEYYISCKVWFGIFSQIKKR